LIQLLRARAQAALAARPLSTRKLGGGGGTVAGIGASDSHRNRLLLDDPVSFDQLVAQYSG
jgi:hypothetical protein